MSVTLVTRDPFPGGSFPLAGRLTSRVGYGMGQVTRHAGNSEAQAKAVELLHVAFDLGITHFDTAQFYGSGLANELLRASFGNRRNDILIATKAEAKPVPGAPIPLEAAQKPFELRAAVEANLRTLGTNWIDVVNLRRMDFTPGLLAGGEQVVPFEDQLAEMAALRDEEKILGIGLSHVTVEQLRTAMPVGISCVQNIYYMVDRSQEPLLELCVKNDIAWIPYSPSVVAWHTPQGHRPGPCPGRRFPSRSDGIAGRPGMAAHAFAKHDADPGNEQH